MPVLRLVFLIPFFFLWHSFLSFFQFSVQGMSIFLLLFSSTLKACKFCEAWIRFAVWYVAESGVSFMPTPPHASAGLGAHDSSLRHVGKQFWGSAQLCKLGSSHSVCYTRSECERPVFPVSLSSFTYLAPALSPIVVYFRSFMQVCTSSYCIY